MSYKVNKEKCIGCGLCVSLCPEVFELEEDSKAGIKKGADLDKNGLVENKKLTREELIKKLKRE